MIRGLIIDSYLTPCQILMDSVYIALTSKKTKSCAELGSPVGWGVECSQDCQ